MSAVLNPTPVLSVKRRLILGLSTAAALLLAPLGASQADAWPSRAVTVISPYNPGGTNDIVARVVADRLSQKLGQPFVVQNRAGAAGSIGATAVMRAPADGYTLLLANNGALIVQSVMREPSPYTPAHDFTAITKVADAPNYIGISNTIPAQTVPEFLAYARARPGELNYSSAGSGSFGNLLAEALNLNADIDIVHVPSNGSSAALTELLAGRVHLMIDPLVLSQRDGDRLRVLATTHGERVAAYPEIPTLVEAGGPDLAITGWFGLLGPAGLPREIVSTLETNLANILQDAEVQKTLTTAGLVPAFLGSGGFQALLSDDHERYTVIKERADLVVQ